MQVEKRKERRKGWRDCRIRGRETKFQKNAIGATRNYFGNQTIEGRTLFYVGFYRSIFRRPISRLPVDRFSKFFFSLKDFEKFYLKIVRALSGIIGWRVIGRPRRHKGWSEAPPT